MNLEDKTHSGWNDMVTILIGEMGSGKNYHGMKFAEQGQVPFLDGDSVIPPVMLARVKRFLPIPPSMIAEYVEGPLFDAIKNCMGSRGIVVAQALYRNEHRVLLRDKLLSAGFQVQFIWIKTPFWRNLQQVSSRPDGWKWALFWLFNKLFFQRPTFDCVIV